MYYNETNTELPSEFRFSVHYTSEPIIEEYDELIGNWDYIDGCYLEDLNYLGLDESRKFQWLDNKLQEQIDEYYKDFQDEAMDTYNHEYCCGSEIYFG